MVVISQAIFSSAFFLNENSWILNGIWLQYVPYGLVDNVAALVKIMAYLSETIFFMFY